MNSVKNKLKWLFIIEFLTILAVVLIITILGKESKAVILGSMILYIPNSLFAWRAFRFQGAKYAKEMLSSFYAGQVSKFILTVFLFATIFKMLQPINAEVLFVTYIAAFIVHQIALLKVMQA
jgi:ATP synthase protein I